MDKKVLLISVPAPAVTQTDTEINYWNWHYALKSKLTYPNLSKDQLLYFGNTENQNIGLLSIASALRENGITVEYMAPSVELVGNRRDWEFLEKVLTKVTDFEPDYIGLSSPTCSLPTAIKYSKMIKTVKPGSITIIGGAHANGCEGDLLEELVNNFDFVIRGKGEIPFVNLVLKSEDKNGICYKKNGVIYENPICMKGLANYPKPANDLLNISYLPAARVFTSLGCGGKCIFCVDINTKKFSEIDEDIIIDEIKYFYKNLGTRYFYLGDENFFFNKSRAFRLIQKISALDLDIILGFQARVESTDESIVKNIAKFLNCTEIQYGVESASQEILNTAKKGLKIEKVREICELTKEYGMNTQCYFLAGLPGETEETAELTINMMESFLEKGIIDMAEYRCVIPFPGSTMWNEKDKYGIKLKNINWGEYRGENHPPFDLETMSSERIHQCYLEGLKRITDIYSKRYMRDFGYEKMDINVLSAITEGGF